MSLTTRDIWLEARALLDKASEVYKEKGMSAEHRAAINDFHNFRDNIDTELFTNLERAQDWIRVKHEYVFWNSTWSATSLYFFKLDRKTISKTWYTFSSFLKSIIRLSRC